jgi:tetratricopeptide (TPR) repeat protein
MYYAAAAEGNEPVQMKLHKSLRLWSFYVDLEESLGTLESTRAVYERILDLRIATPQIILNYAFLLEENKYFEDAFKVYERGVKIFKYPHVRDIWVTYLSKFVKRYGKSKLDRARELFEQAIEQVNKFDINLISVALLGVSQVINRLISDQFYYLQKHFIIFFFCELNNYVSITTSYYIW